MVSKNIQIKVSTLLAGEGLNNLNSNLKRIETSSKSTSNSLKTTSTSFDQLNQKATQSSKGMDKHTQSTKNAQTATTGLQSKIGGLKGAFSGLNGIMAGLIGVGVTGFLKECIDKAKSGADAWHKFQISIKSTGPEFDRAKKQITDLAKQNHFLVGDTRNATQAFLNYGIPLNTITKQHGSLQAAMALSSKTGQTLEESTSMLINGYQGKDKALQKLGISTKKYMEALGKEGGIEKVNSEIMEKYADDLRKRGETYEAAMIDMENATNNFKSSIGIELLPMVTEFTKKLTDLITNFNSLPKPAKKVVAALMGIVGVGLILGPMIAALTPAIKLLAGGLGLFKKIPKIGKLNPLGGGKIKTSKADITAGIVNVKGKTVSGGGGSKPVPGGTGGKGLTAAGLLTGGVVVAAIASMAAVVYGNSTLTPEQRTDAHKRDMGITKPSDPNTPGGVGYVDPNPANLTPEQTKSRDFWNNPFAGIKLPTTQDILHALNLDHPIQWPEFKWPVIPNPFEGWTWPTFTWPVIPNPFEGWTWPSFSWPQVTIPQWHWPSFNWPHVSIPQWHWPSFSWPHITMPTPQQIAAALKGHGPRGPVHAARGRGIPGLQYENYGGHKKDAWNSSGTCLTGNCVDMTLGLMGRYGGGMVAGTWNGGPHVWWQAPSGQQLDPARKALDGTWTPPARGPSDPSFGTTIIIQGDIYGFEDFKKKVEEANTKITFDAARF